MKWLSALAATLALGLTVAGCAGAGEIEVRSAWARSTPPGAAVGAVYLEIRNTGTGADRLRGITSTIARKTELHGTMMHGGMAHMRAVPELEVPAGATIRFEPGGLHVMLIGLREPLVAGQLFTLQLEFEHAGRHSVPVEVRDPR